MLQQTPAGLLKQSAALLRPAAIGFAVALFSMLLFFALNYVSLGRAGQEQVAEAFATGELTEDNWPKGDTIRGVHQYNDCLILALATDQRYSVRELAVSPSHPFGANSNICVSLKAGEQFSQRDFYHNYVHGHTTLARFLLPELGVAGMRALYRSTTSLVLVVGIGLCFLRVAQGQTSAGLFLIPLLGFARFFGLETFGQSLSHGPADLVAIAYVFWFAFRQRTLSSRQATLAAACLGALTMIFEFMTGGLPLGLAIVIGITWFGLRVPSLRDCTASAVAYVSSALSTISIKYTAVALVFGHNEVFNIAKLALIRVNGDVTVVRADGTLFTNILVNTGALAPGLELLISLAVLLALGFGAWALHRERHRPEISLLALSNGPILGWLILFRQHTIIHAWFMDRILVWLIISGGMMFALAVASRSGWPVAAEGSASIEARDLA